MEYCALSIPSAGRSPFQADLPLGRNQGLKPRALLFCHFMAHRFARSPHTIDRYDLDIRTRLDSDPLP
jgi:hypothetical protein